MSTGMEQTLTIDEQNEARSLYEEFWKLHPNVKNPSNINTVEKAYFLILKGFEKIRLMQQAYEQGYDFTKPNPNEDSESIDYRGILKKYMQHVCGCEGIDFTDRLNEHWNGSDVKFDKEEVADLIKISVENECVE
jgi:hypothetical protein